MPPTISVSAHHRFPPAFCEDDGDDEDNGGFIRTPKRLKRQRRRAALAALQQQQQDYEPKSPPNQAGIPVPSPTPPLHSSHWPSPPPLPPPLLPSSTAVHQHLSDSNHNLPAHYAASPAKSPDANLVAEDSDPLEDSQVVPVFEVHYPVSSTTPPTALDSEDPHTQTAPLDSAGDEPVDDMDHDFMIDNGSQLPLGVDVVALEMDVDISRIQASLVGLRRARTMLDEEISRLEDTISSMVATRSLHIDRNMLQAGGESWDPYVRPS